MKEYSLLSLRQRRFRALIRKGTSHKEARMAGEFYRYLPSAHLAEKYGKHKSTLRINDPGGLRAWVSPEAHALFHELKDVIEVTNELMR